MHLHSSRCKLMADHLVSELALLIQCGQDQPHTARAAQTELGIACDRILHEVCHTMSSIARVPLRHISMLKHTGMVGRLKHDVNAHNDATHSCARTQAASLHV